jgi:hypothetical protein
MKKPQRDESRMRCFYCDKTHIYFVGFIGEFYCPDCHRILWRDDIEKAKKAVEKSAPPKAKK